MPHAVKKSLGIRPGSSVGYPPVVVIVGPTASGKTKLAVALARRFNGEIISADSRQVYRGMDVGTGKDLDAYGVKAQSVKRKAKNNPVRYHLIDVVSPRRQFTVAEYQRRAYRAIEDILRRGKLPIICGGTGLYVDAVVQGFQLPGLRIANDELRQVRQRLDRLTLLQLHAQLQRVDPVTYRVIDRQNRRRVQRAVEIFYATGQPKSRQLVKRPPPYRFLILGVRLAGAKLHRRIAARLRRELRQGLVAEVKRLHRRGLSWQRLESFGLEYRWVSRYLRGVVSQPAMERQLCGAIKAYARRQMTWWNRHSTIVWVSGTRAARRRVVALLTSPSGRPEI